MRKEFPREKLKAGPLLWFPDSSLSGEGGGNLLGRHEDSTFSQVSRVLTSLHSRTWFLTVMNWRLATPLSVLKPMSIIVLFCLFVCFNPQMKVS